MAIATYSVKIIILIDGKEIIRGRSVVTGNIQTPLKIGHFFILAQIAAATDKFTNDTT